MVRCAITVALVAVTCMVGASLSGSAGAAEPCWQRVISDWTDGRVDAAYAPHCYRDAVKHLPEDLRTYSSAADDINRALLEATSRQKRSIASGHLAARALESSVVAAKDSTPLAAVLVGALGGVVVVTGGASAWLLARRRS